MIKPGDKIPSVTLQMKTEGGVNSVTTDELFAGKKVVLFGVPGAFTPTCTNRHLPGFIEKAPELRDKGVDRIVCVAVNDVFVMDAWGKAAGAKDEVEMVADGSGKLAKALGLELDLIDKGMGVRSKRFAAVVDDGTVKSIHVDESGLEKSSAEAILALM